MNKMLILTLTLTLLMVGCIFNNPPEPTPTTPSEKATLTQAPSDQGYVAVIGYLTYYNEYQHGVWLVEIPRGTVQSVKILCTNQVVWEYTDFYTTSNPRGILILSKPNPLAIGYKYYIDILPETGFTL